MEYLVLDTDGALAEPAVEAYLGQLQGERDAEAAALKVSSLLACVEGSGAMV